MEDFVVNNDTAAVKIDDIQNDETVQETVELVEKVWIFKDAITEATRSSRPIIGVPKKNDPDLVRFQTELGYSTIIPTLIDKENGIVVFKPADKSGSF
jgi:hypothetical protein